MQKYILFSSMEHWKETRKICQILSTYDIPFELLTSWEAEERGPALQVDYMQVRGLEKISRFLEENF